VTPTGKVLGKGSRDYQRILKEYDKKPVSFALCQTTSLSCIRAETTTKLRTDTKGAAMELQKHRGITEVVTATTTATITSLIRKANRQKTVGAR